MLEYNEEKRPAFFRRVAADALFEGLALIRWKGLEELPKLQLDQKLDQELDDILGSAFMPRPGIGGASREQGSPE